MYIHFVGRETSKTAFEINTSYSDEETSILYRKTTAILEAIINEIKRVEKKLSKSTLSETDRRDSEAYKKKLVRYKKFFKYRNQELAFRETDDINVLKQKLLRDLQFLEDDNNINGKKEFFEKYNEDTLGASIGFVLKSLKDAGEDYKDITRKIVLLNTNLFGRDNKSSSYLRKSYSKYIDGPIVNKFDSINISVNKYSKLNEYVKLKWKFINKKNDHIRTEAAKKILMTDEINICFEKIVSKNFLNNAHIVIQNSNTLQRMMLNAIFSCIFDIDISDGVILKKNNNRKITYFELRLLELLRNKHFCLEKLKSIQDNLLRSEYSQYIDYSIMQVIGIFSTFVSEPIYIDNLILVHKYTCDIWKNGSKHLYFYTLHNQEHAVDLVQNSIKILKSIDYIDISRNDYYVLFIACYLHDISMVTLPDLNKLQQDEYTTNKLYSDFTKDYNPRDSKKDILKLLKDYYMKIDSYYEGLVRDNHAKDSANEIRNRKELGFIDSSLREIVAEISEAHGYDVRDIYKIKSVAKSKMWSIKFTKIILRLADLLDMSNYRVSKLILDHNLDNMGTISRFHWLSHIVTSGYEIKTTYYLKKTSDSRILAPGNIVENIILRINVDLPQITEEKPVECKKIKLIELNNSLIKLKCGESCNYGKCNFLCKWFSKKNYYLFEELDALQTYLSDLQENYFSSEIQVIIQSSNRNPLNSEQFTLLKNFVTDN